MNRSHQGQQHEPESMSSAAALVVPLDTLDRTSLPVAGSKAANLGELIRAGFTVPAGFCVTTAAYARVSARAGLDTYLSALEAVARAESARQIELATAIRTALCQTPLPPEVIEAVTSAYQALSAGEPIPVSVRSSATAEDLPEASFAGQQETFLNVIGIQAVLTAVQQCFASLWTDRATQYRDSLGIAPRAVRLAVVVQRMVEAEVAGGLFTANPLTGKRRQAMIADNPGLGEAVVSGESTPDHFVCKKTLGEIFYRRLGVQQARSRPSSPSELTATPLAVSGGPSLIASPVRDPLVGTRFVAEAASRPVFEVTAALRSAFGRRFLMNAMREAEVHAATSFQQLVTDPRLSLRKTPLRAFGRALALLLARTRLPWYLLQAFLSPKAANARVQRFVEQLRNAHQIDASADAAAHLAAAERLLQHCLRLAFRVSPVMLAGMLSFALARRLLGELASESECQVVLGGSPTNPTTRMNLALWRLSQEIRADATSRQLLQSTSAARLAQDYQQGRLPDPLQQGLPSFLQAYGHQGVCELDLGVPRWSEDPTYVLALLTGYLEMEESAHAPDRQLQRAGRSARAMIATLAQRAGQKHWLRGRLVRLCLERAHALAGFREMTRFVVGLFLAQARELLWPVGEELARAGRLKEAADLFFLTFPEAHALLSGADLRERVSERQATFARKLGRRHVPLVLLSDGTEPTAQPQTTQSTARSEKTLQGTPASAGRVTAPARVILDPHDVRLSPGEILVAPSTDPGWTPLFLTASGLVMEMGGPMSHGAVVAREYGIPAVVGVPGAINRITTGQQITVDGSHGNITLG